jgi:thiol-disulfide isomerase/thioredoxin/YHS domain-containing protein
MRTTWFALSLCLTLASGVAARTALADPTPASIWKTDFAAAEAEAKSLNRPLVVHFGAVWCGPCKKMEKEVLFTPQALKLLEAGFVAVKVDLDKNGSIGKKYRVEQMPTDLIISPEGKVLVRSEGYVTGDQPKYMANLSRFGVKTKPHVHSDVLDAGRSVAGPRDSQPAVQTDRAIASANPSSSSTREKLAPPPNKIDPPVGSRAIDPTTPAEPDEVDSALEPEGPAEDIQVAMDGYCPVTLRTTRTWKSGSKDISLEHDGQIFYFTSADKRDEFRAHPARYAPRLLGCDPVTLADNDVAVRGSTQYGAFYDGALFLFESAASRAKFRKTPTRYSQLKHVLKPEDVKNVASNVDP